MGLLPAPIIDAERVCKFTCKRAEEDCSVSVARSATKVRVTRFKHSAEAREREHETHHLYAYSVLAMLP